MNTARIVVLAIALAAGGVAAFLASGSDPAPAPAPVAAPPEQKPTDDVLVARKDIPLGFTVTEDDLQWQDWPNASSGTFIRRVDQPEAMKKFAGYIVRSPFVAGEPIRETKLVEGKGSGFMAAILPIGMRAVSVEISPETGAGGFILPNDRVDVVMSRREKSDNGGPDKIISEMILTDIRVLAIDQQVEEKNGLKVVVGKTATLEVKPDQAETLGRAKQGGTLLLALRSMRQNREVQAQTEIENRVTVFRGTELETLNCTPKCDRGK